MTTTKWMIKHHREMILKLDKKLGENPSSFVKGALLTMYANHQTFMDIYERIAKLEGKRK